MTEESSASQIGSDAPPAADPEPDAEPVADERPAGESSTVARASLAPRTAKQRFIGLDAARGFALLGIFLVNIDFFALPLGVIAAPARDNALDLVLQTFVKIFAEGKFYPLFSLLFGMGLVLQRQSVERAGGHFVPLYLRRTVILFAIGLVHALALWYGDILLIYALVAVVALFLSRWSAKRMAVVGIGAWALAGLILGSLAFFEPAVPVAEAPTRGELLAEAEAVELEQTPLATVAQLLQEADASDTLIETPQWLAAEIAAYREGPYFQALGFRVASYGIVFLIFLFGGALDILGMFLLGGAFVKWGLLETQGEKWLLRMVGLAMLIGLPGAAFGVLAPSAIGGQAGNMLSELLRIYCGPLLSAGYFAAVVLLARSGLATALIGGLAAAGRMALSNYLLQTLVATFVMYHWGLAMFARLPAIDRVWLVFGVFVVQVLGSQLWLSHFRFGPLEWVWRTVTYGKAQPLRRA